MGTWCWILNEIQINFDVLYQDRNTVQVDGFAYVSRYAKEEGEADFGIAHRKNSVSGNPINVFVFDTENLLSVEDKRLFWERMGMHGLGGMCLNVSLDEPRKNLETCLNMVSLRQNVGFVRIGKWTPRLKVLIEKRA